VQCEVCQYLYLTCISYSRVGNPEDSKYADSCELQNMHVAIGGGIVSGIPVPDGHYRVFTVDVSAFMRKEQNENLFSDFEMHCMLAGKTRWQNAWVPRVNKEVTVIGDIVGRWPGGSLCVIVDQFVQGSMSPRGNSTVPPASAESTPRYASNCVLT
jgi:hypothetical protein